MNELFCPKGHTFYSPQKLTTCPTHRLLSQTKDYIQEKPVTIKKNFNEYICPKCAAPKDSLSKNCLECYRKIMTNGKQAYLKRKIMVWEDRLSHLNQQAKELEGKISYAKNKLLS